jgi:hypothetical protein
MLDGALLGGIVDTAVGNMLGKAVGMHEGAMVVGALVGAKDGAVGAYVGASDGAVGMYVGTEDGKFVAYSIAVENENADPLKYVTDLIKKNIFACNSYVCTYAENRP